MERVLQIIFKNKKAKKSLIAAAAGIVEWEQGAKVMRHLFSGFMHKKLRQTVCRVAAVELQLIYSRKLFLGVKFAPGYIFTGFDMAVNPCDVGAVVVQIRVADTAAAAVRSSSCAVFRADGIQIAGGEPAGAEPDRIPVSTTGTGVVGTGKVRRSGGVLDHGFFDPLVQTGGSFHITIFVGLVDTVVDLVFRVGYAALRIFLENSGFTGERGAEPHFFAFQIRTHQDREVGIDTGHGHITHDLMLFVVIAVHALRSTDLFEVAYAVALAGAFARGTQSRQQHGSEDSDDGDYHRSCHQG